MSAHLVETSEEDSFLAVARFVGELLNEGEERTALAETTGSQFTSDCETLLVEGRFGPLLERFISQLDTILTKAKDKDLECCLNIMCHLVQRLPAAEAGPLVERLSRSLSDKADVAPEARLAALVELYNVTLDLRLRYSVLLSLLQYALSAGLQDLLTPVLKSQLESWISELELDDVRQRQLLLAAANLFRASKKKRSGTKEAFALLVRAVDGAAGAEVGPLKPAAAALVADFIRSPDLLTFDVAEAPAVAALAGDKEAGDSHALLTVLLTGDVKEFEAFADAHPNVFAAVGASRGDVLDKARLMTLMALAARSREVAFADIQAALAVPEAEVEGWVVRAIGKGLIEGKIDQLRECVTISQASTRSFGSNQWATLREQLGTWRERLVSMQDTMASTKAQLPKGVPPIIKV